jgi:hypothetical protein
MGQSHRQRKWWQCSLTAQQQPTSQHSRVEHAILVLGKVEKMNVVLAPSINN